ncbi:MAG: hypothetical protein J1F35_07350 [Erysipelotrichales bacterium]|nr:hypothetical protein [Erysipelotrichales bacterium]
MDQEFYFEETNPKKVKAVIITILVVGLLLCGVFLYIRNLYTLNVKKEVVFEAGTKISYDVTDYINNKIVDKDDYTLLFSSVTMEDDILNKVGTYTFKVKYKNITRSGKIKVVDTTAPVVEVQELTVGEGEEFETSEFITKCEDYSLPCDVTYEKKSDENNYKKEGSYTFKIVIRDNQNNKATKEVNLTVKKGFNLTNTKESDLTIDHTDPEFSDWNDKMVLKFSKGYDPNEIDDTDEYGEFLEISGDDLHKYIDPLYENNAIVEKQLIDVYNKYGLLIGFAIRIKLDNGLYLYLENN